MGLKYIPHAHLYSQPSSDIEVLKNIPAMLFQRIVFYCDSPHSVMCRSSTMELHCSAVNQVCFLNCCLNCWCLSPDMLQSFIHFLSAFPGWGSWWQQAEKVNPDFCSTSYRFQLLLGDVYNLSSWSRSAPGLYLVGHAWYSSCRSWLEPNWNMFYAVCCKKNILH